MILPSQYATAEPLDLLRHAEQGLIGLDQRLLSALIARPEATLAALAKFIDSPDPNRLVDLTEQVFDLYRCFNAPQAAPFYVGLLRESLDDIPDEIIEALAALGRAAVDPLLELHASLPGDDAASVVFVLAATGVREERIAKLLLDTLKADPYEGALSIGLYGDSALAGPVKEVLDALPESASEERKAIAGCLDTLAAGEAREASPAPDVLPAYPEAAPPLFDYLDNQQLIEFLSCPEPSLRHDAAASLVDTQYPEPVLDVLLGVAASDPDTQVRQAALRAIGENATEPRASQLLMSTLCDESGDARLRAAALVGLAQAPSSEAFRSHAAQFLAGPATRAAALEAMWRSGSKMYIPSFRAPLRDPDPAVQLQAIRGVGAFPIPPLAIEMIPFFSSEDLREDALYAYASAVNAKITPKSVQRLLEDIDNKADGLSREELEIVTEALDQRLETEGFEAVFHAPEPDEHDHSMCGHDHPHELDPALPAQGAQAAPATGKHKAGRNEPCPCGSGKKYKKCCGQ